MKRSTTSDLDRSDYDERGLAALLDHERGRTAVTIVAVIALALLLGQIMLMWSDTDQQSDPLRSSTSGQTDLNETNPATRASEDVDRATVTSADLAPALSPDPVASEPAPVSSAPTAVGASVVAIVYPGSIKVSGAVPTQSAADVVVSFVMACSRSPAWIIRELNVDPDAPTDSTVRLIDLTSPSFEPSSSSVVGGHALQLDHIGSLLQSMPALSLDIVGHVDRDRTVQPFHDLAEARARADVDYLVAAGIAPERLSTIRSAGLGTPGGEDSELASALLGRTEFIFSGLSDS